jgi:hypothetical protein
VPLQSQGKTNVTAFAALTLNPAPKGEGLPNPESHPVLLDPPSLKISARFAGIGPGASPRNCDSPHFQKGQKEGKKKKTEESEIQKTEDQKG